MPSDPLPGGDASRALRSLPPAPCVTVPWGRPENQRALRRLGRVRPLPARPASSLPGDRSPRGAPSHLHRGQDKDPFCLRSGGALAGACVHTRAHACLQGRVPGPSHAAGAISVPLALVSGHCTVLTITRSQELPRAGVEKASRREKQLESCFLLRQVYFSLQLCLTKASLCGRRFPKKG